MYTHLLLIRPQIHFRNVVSHFTDVRYSKRAETKLEHNSGFILKYCTFCLFKKLDDPLLPKVLDLKPIQANHLVLEPQYSRTSHSIFKLANTDCQKGKGGKITFLYEIKAHFTRGSHTSLLNYVTLSSTRKNITLLSNSIKFHLF